MKKRVFTRTIFVNKRNKQASITLPRKSIKFLKNPSHIPRKIKIKIEEAIW